MVLVLVLVFLAVFAVTALLLTASRTDDSADRTNPATFFRRPLRRPSYRRQTRPSISVKKSCSAPFHGSIAGC